MFCSPCSGFFTPAGGNSMAPRACQAWQSNFSKSIFAPSHIFVCWAKQQTKQNVQYLLPEQKINIIGVTFRCSPSAGSGHSAPLTGNVRQCRHNSWTLAGNGPDRLLPPRAPSWSHGSNLGLKFLCNRQSHIWPLQWMSAVASGSLLQHWSAYCGWRHPTPG